MKQLYILIINYLVICDHYILYIISIILRFTTRVNKKRIICNSFTFTKYACNPRCITEYLLQEHPNEYEIYWCFRKDINIPNLPTQIKIVRWKSLKYLYIINSSKFIISNCRLGLWDGFLFKKKSQKYIMTWHASMGIKKVEKHVENMLDSTYVKKAKFDSSICDLILSGCNFNTKIIKEAFWYNGEILEKGTPRNDILFKKSELIQKKIYKLYNLDTSVKIILYAPTFRKDYSIQHYKLDWNNVLSLLNNKNKENYIVMIRLHPNHSSYDIPLHPNVINASDYPDIQELLCISDILITDYSSCMFDFSLLLRPVFIYATDYNEYDRGTYIQLEDLPFSVAHNDQELIRNIKNFNLSSYQQNLIKFNTETICSYEKGKASEAVYNWMQKIETKSRCL